MEPTFQPQNPNLNGFKYGWLSCTSYAYAMGASYDRQVARYVTGQTLRMNCRYADGTVDLTGGTTLAQNDRAMERLFGFSLDVRTPVRWEELIERNEGGQGVVLQGHGEVFEGTRFYCAASVPHAVFVPPDRGAMDPSADGRRPEIYRYHNERYPEDLLRRFAGRTILSLRDPSKRLGLGWAYAAFTIDRTADHEAIVRPLPGHIRREFTVYPVRNMPNGTRVISGKPEIMATKGFAIPCTEPKQVYTASLAATVSLVKLIHPGHPQDGWWLSARWERPV